MLKGKAKIELTNIHTGETETIEENNMFTKGLEYTLNALEQFPDAVKFSQSQEEYQCMYPIIENLLGGIMIFSNRIEENEENIYPPTEKDGITMTGCANLSINDVAEMTFRGSWNENESGLKEDGSYTFVWDFNSDQANGTIASLALVPACAGINGVKMDKKTLKFGYGLKRISKKSSTKNYYMQDVIYFDRKILDSNIWTNLLKSQNKDDKEIKLNPISSGYAIKSIDEKKGVIKFAHVENQDNKLIFFAYDIKVAMNEIGLNDIRYYATQIVNKKSIELTENSESGEFGSLVDPLQQIQVFEIDEDRYLVGRYMSYTYPTQSEDGALGSSVMKYMVINMASKKIESKFEKTIPFVGDDSRYRTYATYIKDQKKLLYTNAQKYVKKNDGWQKVNYNLLVNYENFTEREEIYCYDGEEIANEEIKLYGNIQPRQILPGRYSLNAPNVAYLVKEQSGWKIETYNNMNINNSLLCNIGYGITFLFDVTGLIANVIVTGDNSSLTIRKEMIGTVMMTINNLESPVEKTADKTMKITYTVREVQEDE